MRPLAAIAAGALLLAGCNNDCFNLATNICECSPTQQGQQACQAAAALANGVQALDSATVSRCTALLQTCDCRMLASGSYAGKVACGLARPDPNDVALNHP